MYQAHPLRMEDFTVTCPLVPGVPHLLSSSCSSPRAFGLGFLQTPPRDDALALFLAFGSANTWRKDFHLTSSVPCPAHTLAVSCRKKRTLFPAAPVPCSARFGLNSTPTPLICPSFLPLAKDSPLGAATSRVQMRGR